MVKGLRIIQAGLKQELTTVMSEHNEWTKEFITKNENLGSNDVATQNAKEMMEKYEKYKKNLARLNYEIEDIIEQFK